MSAAYVGIYWFYRYLSGLGVDGKKFFLGVCMAILFSSTEKTQLQSPKPGAIGAWIPDFVLGNMCHIRCRYSRHH